jgi:hypothetical protein
MNWLAGLIPDVTSLKLTWIGVPTSQMDMLGRLAAETGVGQLMDLLVLTRTGRLLHGVQANISPEPLVQQNLLVQLAPLAPLDLRDPHDRLDQQNLQDQLEVGPISVLMNGLISDLDFICFLLFN